MNIVWLFGNGFDLNLGLKCGYSHFLKDNYLKSQEPELVKRRDRLLEVMGEDPFQEGSCWSDLERLLGQATQHYEDDVQLFCETFEGMGQLFAEQAERENEIFHSRDLEDKMAEEFRKSIIGFPRRLAELDKDRVGAFRNTHENIEYSFVTLNYTTTLETFLSKVKSLHDPIETRRFPGAIYSDKVSDVFHPHGDLENGSIVFAVGDEEQIASTILSQDEDFKDLWVKHNRNCFFGNKKTLQLNSIIDEADLLCLYGLSLGASDCYIWRMIRSWLLVNQSHKLVIFVHDLPKKESFNCWAYKQEFNKAMAKIQVAFELTDEELDMAKDRIILLPSDVVFRFDMSQS